MSENRPIEIRDLKNIDNPLRYIINFKSPFAPVTMALTQNEAEDLHAQLENTLYKGGKS